MSATADLLDVNVWLALSVDGHPHHQAALAAWEDLNRPSFCRLTQLGLMRLLCDRQVMGRLTLEPAAAWAEYEKIRARGAAQMVEEPAGLEASLKSFTKDAKATRDFWTDAYLAAFARSADMRLVSFDAGFARFSIPDCLVLESGK